MAIYIHYANQPDSLAIDNYFIRCQFSHSAERSLNDVQFSEIPSDTDLVTIANIAIANDDEVVLNAAKKLWQFRQMNSKLVKAEGFGTVVRGLWNRYGSRLQPLIKIAINALRGHVANILSRHPTVKQYVQQLLCGY